MELFGGKKSGKHASGGKNKTPAANSSKNPAPAGKAKNPTPEGSRKNDTVRSDGGTKYSSRPSDTPEAFTAREEKRANRKWLRRVLIAVGVIAVILVGAYVWLQLWTAPPEVNVNNPTTHTPQTSLEPGTSAPPATEPPLDSEAPAQAVTSDRRPGTYTFAIVGTDVVAGNTDTILVGMLDTVAGKLNFVSLPRDTLVNTGYDFKNINYVYPACVNNGKDGMAALLDVTEDMLGFKVDSYALVDVETCAKLVDAIGGVWFDVPVDMDWDAWDQDPPCYIHIPKGYQLLDGANAVKVMRFRYSADGTNTYKGGDIDRIQVQHDLLMAIAKQMLSVGNIPNLGKLINIYEENVTTNVTAKNLSFYAQEFLKLGADDISFKTLPANYYGQLYGRGYCFPYINDWLAMINTDLNPFSTDITTANIDMLYMSGNTVCGTQGYIKGGIESFNGYTP
ncbi:MAG: LCP family protein [Oscillospiraceae bacterium]